MSSNKVNILTRFLILSALTLGLTSCGGGGTPAATPTTNNAPVATDAGVSLLPGGSVTGTLVVNDIDGDNLTISIVTDASNGTLTLDNATTGAYTYAHGGAANGDSFTFMGFDGLLDSNIATVTVTTVVPDAPASGLLATAGDQRVTLNWDVVTDADSYNVYWSNASSTGTGGTKITGVTSPFYHDGIVNVGDYFYVVTAVNAVGESAASLEVSATPLDILVSSLTFADTNLQACVDTNAGVLNVHELTSLDCSAQNITELTGIEALTSLTTLYLYTNSISNVSPLASLTSLTYLSLYTNSISNVSPLASLTKLITLYIGSNSISDASPLAGLTNLTSLSLSNTSISDVSPLASLTSLTYLSLSNTSISDVSPLASLTNLITLHLLMNNISDVSPLASLTSLISLDLSNNNSISDVSPLASLTNLETLQLGTTSISDVSPLASLTKLITLSLSRNSISDVSPLASLTSLTTLSLSNNSISDVSPLASLTSLATLFLQGNIVMSCSTLTGLIASLGSPPVDTDFDLANTDAAINGVNCTNP